MKLWFGLSEKSLYIGCRGCTLVPARVNAFFLKLDIPLIAQLGLFQLIQKREEFCIFGGFSAPRLITAANHEMTFGHEPPILWSILFFSVNFQLVLSRQTNHCHHNECIIIYHQLQYNSEFRLSSSLWSPWVWGRTWNRPLSGHLDARLQPTLH